MRGAALPEALRSRRFWLLACSFATVSLVMGGWNANLVPILEGQGLATTEAAALALALPALGLLVSRFFGLAYYGEIYALSVLPITFATAIGTVVVGRAKDVGGGFEGVSPLMIGLLLARTRALDAEFQTGTLRAGNRLVMHPKLIHSSEPR